MEKKIIWSSITIYFVINGGVFIMIILWNIFDKVFWMEGKIYGWDHFYTFLIIRAMVMFSNVAILYKMVFRETFLFLLLALILITKKRNLEK